MDEEKKDGSINPKESSLPTNTKEGQTGQAGEEERKKVVVKRGDLAKTLRKLKGRPQRQGPYREPQIFSEKTPKSFIKEQDRKAKKERERQASMPTFDEKALSKETAVPLEKIKFEKVLQKIQTGEKDPVVREALLITVKLIFYHLFTPQKATELKMKQVPTLPPDLQSDIKNYLQHLQALPISSMDPDSPLFPCYQSKELNPTIWSKLGNTPERKLTWFLGRHKCPSPQSLRELGKKFNHETLLRKGIESSQAIREIGKKFGSGKKKVKTDLGWVDSPGPLKKQIQKTYWDKSSFLKKLESKGGIEEIKVAERILQWAEEKDLDIESGTGSQTGSYYVIKQVRRGQKEEIFWSISLWTNRVVKIEFKKLQYFDEKKRLELRQRLNEITGVPIPENEIYQRPGIPLSVLVNEDILNQFISVIWWMITEQAGRI